MRIGIIGVGVVGGALYNWLENNTAHDVYRWDPYKGYTEELYKSDAIFICTPVKPGIDGQNQVELESTVKFAKSYCDKVFIRSTVLPGTNDRLNTIACPEFLTARISNEEMDRLPILVGSCEPELIKAIFTNKQITIVSNKEAELAKFAHNCFGAMKVTYFNIIYDICNKLDIDYKNVLEGVLLSGFINKPHTQVPGPDGKLGYAGACFPENMEAMRNWLMNNESIHKFSHLISLITSYNNEFRFE